MKSPVTVWFKRAISALALVLPFSAIAQNLYVYPTTTNAPRGSYQTVTAIVTGVNDKTVTWSSDGGTIVGTNPCTANEPCTVALYTTNTGTYHLTASSNANHSVIATSTITFTPSPTPRTDHPRFMVTPDTIAGLRAKATSTNPMYQALQSLATSALNRDNSIWSWSCNGGTGQPNADQSQNWKEQDAYIFAILSAIAPTATERNQWGCYGHDVFMTMAGYVLNGSLDLSQGNHWSDSARPFTLTPDLLMGGGYLASTADLNTTRQYLAKIAFEQINDVYNGTLAVIGGYNSPTQLAETDQWSITGMRGMGNNYTQSRILFLAAAALTFNDTATDDPPLANTCNATRYQVCPDGTAGSLHAYWTYVTGGMLYKDWANMDDPTVAQQAYNAAFNNLPTQPMCNAVWNAPTPCFGLGRGGEPNEGTFYGTSLSRLRWALNAIHTAGYDDPIQYGPQMSIATSSYWDLRYVADLTLLTGPSASSNENSRWTFLTDGDTLNYFAYPSNYVSESATLVANALTGRTDGTAAMQWLVMNTAFGMASGTSGGCLFYCGFDSELSNDIGSATTWDMFVALPATDPVTVNPPADPRPSLPTDWYDAGNQHIVARNNWTTNANTIFSYYCTDTEIDHEHQYCGGFSVYSNGEYITKGRMEFNNYINEYSAGHNQNIPEYVNQPTLNASQLCGYFSDACVDGGQLWHGYQAGLNNLLHSELPTYVAALADTTNSYNGGWGGFGNYNGITQASRSLVFLRQSNQIVYYDRGASGSNSWDKANYLVTTGTPTINGNTASWLTRSGRQTVSWTSLAPVGATPVLDATYTDADAANDWEIYGRLKVDAGNVPSARFLSVLGWQSTGSNAAPPSRVTSTSGTSFEGALAGSSLVLFMHDWPATFASVTYPASGATTHYVADLTPNTTYSISGTGTPATATADNAGVLTFSAAGTGSITIAAGAIAAAPTKQLQTIVVSPATATVQAASTQQYSASCTYSDASTSNCTSSVTWSTNSTSVATISSSGLATAVAQGTATITASASSVQGQATLTVPAATLQSISVSPASASIAIGGTQQLKATGVYSDSSTIDISSVVTWSSSNTSVVSTTASGLAAGLSQGNANVTAASGSVHGQASIAVTQTASPTFSPAGGTYASAQTVTISTTTPSSTIYYTTNGTTPTTTSAVYSGPITVSSTETVEAIAVASGSSASSVASATYTITTAASAPVFSPAGGTYSGAQNVTISTSTPSAAIYYTTDGSTPSSSSNRYTGAISVSSSETVKAITVASGYSNSSVSSAVYTINVPTAATPTFTLAGGQYTSAQNVGISTTTAAAVLYYTTDGSTPTTASAVYSGPIAVSSSMTLRAIAAANGYNNSAVASATYTISAGQAAAPVFSPAPGRYTTIQSVTLTTSTPFAQIHYTTDGSKPTMNSPVYSGPITVASSISIKAFAISSTTTSSSTVSGNYNVKLAAVAAPSFSPSGGKYTSVQTVSVTSATAGATIYFTTDGSTPTTSSQLYTGPITVGSTETVKAIAVEAGYPSSSVSSASYTITLASPAFSLKASTSSVTVTRGHASTTNVQVIPENGFSAPVELSCSGLPAWAACSFSPGIVTPPGAPTTTVLTISAAAQVASGSQPSSPGAHGAASLALLAFCSFGFKRRKAYRVLSIAVFGMVATSMCTGCGGQVNYNHDATSVVTIVGVHDSMQPTTTVTLTVL